MNYTYSCILITNLCFPFEIVKQGHPLEILKQALMYGYQVPLVRNDASISSENIHLTLRISIFLVNLKDWLDLVVNYLNSRVLPGGFQVIQLISLVIA